MKTYEFSKYDFNLIDEVLDVEIKLSQGFRKFNLEKLKDLFAKAHTGYLEIEED